MNKHAGGTIRIAMWSGPRNISTAMMRSFENRPDTAVVDEPFYGAFLAASKIDHPMRQEILEHTETDPVSVSRSLLIEGPESGIHYQKHMTHHMLDHFPREWVAHVTNAFLIRDPYRVVASYAAKRSEIMFRIWALDNRSKFSMRWPTASVLRLRFSMPMTSCARRAKR